MKTKGILMLGVIIALLLVTSVTSMASADGAVAGFRAYYPVWAVPTPDPTCGCLQQAFTPGGNGNATHMGVSLFSGHAQAWQGVPIIQIGDGTLTSAKGSLTVHYEGTAKVIDGGQHIVTDGWYKVTDATGNFKNMTGEGTYHVYVYTDGSQPNDLWFKGDLHK